MRKIILASGSPRRHQLLNMIHLDHEVFPSSVEETVKPGQTPSEAATDLALQKGVDVAAKFAGALCIAADTVVVLNDELLGKPVSEADAVSMLKKLSGKTHQVITGVALVENLGSNLPTNGSPDAPKFRWDVFYQTTEVTFSSMTDAEIIAYVKTGSPMDKAGSYGIQDDLGSLFVESVNGDYYNVVGLPVNLLYQRLKEFDIDVVEHLVSSNPKFSQSL